MPHKSVEQDCPTNVFYKSVPQECFTQVFRKSVPQECQTLCGCFFEYVFTFAYMNIKDMSNSKNYVVQTSIYFLHQYINFIQYFILHGTLYHLSIQADLYKNFIVNKIHCIFFR